MNEEELIGFNDYKSIYSKSFELNFDYISSQCHFMDKEDIYKWILSDEITIINLKQALNEIRDKLLCYGETFDNDIHKQFQKECLQIIDKVLGGE